MAYISLRQCSLPSKIYQPPQLRVTTERKLFRVNSACLGKCHHCHLNCFLSHFDIRLWWERARNTSYLKASSLATTKEDSGYLSIVDSP